MDCLFCKIIKGDIPSEKIYEDERCYAFRDIDPQAPVHFLVVPKEHIAGASRVTDENCAVVGHIYAAIARIARAQGCAGDYRVVTNCGEMSGQTVEHLHFHVLGGRPLAWPPG